MGAIAPQIISLTLVYSAVYSGADQRKHQSPASLAIVRGIHRGPVNSPHKWTVRRKMFPFDDVIMLAGIHTETTSRAITLVVQLLELSGTFVIHSISGCVPGKINVLINTLKPRQNHRPFADDILNQFHWINLHILINISRKFDPTSSIDFKLFIDENTLKIYFAKWWSLRINVLQCHQRVWGGISCTPYHARITR